MTLFRELSQSNKLIRIHKDDLREYAELRNAIVHQTKDEPIAEPYLETVQHLQKNYEILKNPPTLLKIASRPVYSCKVDDLIIEVVTEMTKKVYTHVHVYENNIFIGVFSESSITKWLGDSAEMDGFLLEQARIGDLKKNLDQPNDEFN
jgi:predicted transcriptional regulator